MSMHPLKRVPPEPVTVRLTAKEAAFTHLFLDVFLRAADSGTKLPNNFDIELAKRARKELETRLKAAGCVLDETGWSA